jgi:hypothetical protein
LKIIVDKRIPERAKRRLESLGEVLYLETSAITYPAISGHPDIFFCKAGDDIVYATNAPAAIIHQLNSKTAGHNDVGENYPDTAHYNAVVTENYLIHNSKYTDPVIKERCIELGIIHVSQAYTRCNLIALNQERFITSDRGIEKTLLRRGFEVLYVKSDGIFLPGFEHGFIGGTSGIYEDKIFFIGSLDHFAKGSKIRDFLTGYQIIELYDGPLYDGGSLIFLD